MREEPRKGVKKGQRVLPISILNRTDRDARPAGRSQESERSKGRVNTFTSHENSKCEARLREDPFFNKL